MPKRPLSTTQILTDEQVTQARRLLDSVLAESLPKPSRARRAHVEDTVRWIAVGARCERARRELGCSLREAAQALRVPQYRIKAIESTRLEEVQPDVLQAYVSYLGLQRWYLKWSRANPELASRFLSDGPGSSRPGARGRTKR